MNSQIEHLEQKKLRSMQVVSFIAVRDASVLNNAQVSFHKMNGCGF